MDTAQPVNGGIIFIMGLEWKGAPLGMNARRLNTFVLRCVAHLYFGSSPEFSVKLELFASSALRKPERRAATF